MSSRSIFRRGLAAALLVGLGVASHTSAQAAERIAVAIYEFRSSVPELEARGATDMFVTALVDAGRYRVVERNQLDYGVMREKELGASGQSNGTAHRKKLRGARYIFEGTISEASTGESGQQNTLSIAGLSIGRGKNRETLGIDVRVVDAATGDIVDSISVRKPLKGSSSSISGIGAAASSVLASRGKSLPYSPDASHQSSRQDRLDGALRALIEAAVAELGQRGSIQ